VSITSTYVSKAKWQMIAAARVMIIIVVKRICISRRLILISMTTYIILLANKVPVYVWVLISDARFFVVKARSI